MKIGLFGGSFNPIHKGHIKLAEFAIKNLQLDKLIFIPTFKSLDKLHDFHENNQSRCEMVELVLIPNTECSRYEIDLDFPVPTFLTIEYFANLYKEDELFFLVGDDHIETIETWEGIEIMNKLSTIAVFKRFNNTKKVRHNICTKIVYLNNPIYDLCSNQFRKYKDYSLLDKKVEEYIKKNNLYKN